MNWRVYTVRVVLVLFPLNLVKKFDFLKTARSVVAGLGLGLFSFCSLAGFQRFRCATGDNLSIENCTICWNRLLLGAALSGGAAAIEHFCNALGFLSKQPIFLLCARLVLVPCILPHVLTPHTLLPAESQPPYLSCSTHSTSSLLLCHRHGFAPVLLHHHVA